MVISISKTGDFVLTFPNFSYHSGPHWLESFGATDINLKLWSFNAIICLRPDSLEAYFGIRKDKFFNFLWQDFVFTVELHSCTKGDQHYTLLEWDFT